MASCIPQNISEALFKQENGYDFNDWKDTGFLCRIPSISAAAFEAVRRIAEIDCTPGQVKDADSSDDLFARVVPMFGYALVSAFAVFEISLRVSFVMVNFIAQVGLMLAKAFDIKLPESLQNLAMEGLYAPTIGAALDCAVALVSSCEGIYRQAMDEVFKPKIPFCRH